MQIQCNCLTNTAILKYLNHLCKKHGLGEQFFERPLHELWSLIFQSCPNACSFSALLKIFEVFFCIPGHNGNVERVFSLINAQWRKERNRLLLDSVKGIILTKYKLMHLTCEQFYAYVIANEDLLRKVGSSEKCVINKN